MSEDGDYKSLPIRNSQVLVSQKSLSNYLIEIPTQNLQLDLNVAESSVDLSLPFNNNAGVSSGLCGNYTSDIDPPLHSHYF